MVTPELSKFILSQRSSGIDDSFTRKHLVRVGWSQSDVASALSPSLPASSPIQHSSFNIQNSSSPTTLATKLLSVCALIGLIFILIFFSATFLSGKSIYKSGPQNFSDTNQMLEQTLSLSPSGNPYRIFLTTNYQVLGKPFSSSTKLLEYSYTLTDSKNNSISSGQGSISHSESSSERNDTTTSLQSLNNQTVVVTTFSAPIDDKYALTMPVLLNPSAGSSFQIENVSFEIKERVTLISPLVFLAGFIMLSLPLTIFIIKSRKNKAHQKPL